MNRVKIKDKTFKVFIPEAEIKSRVKAVAEQINKDLDGKNPLFLCILNGAFVFAADLLREVTIPYHVSFVKLASYQGTISTGKVKEIFGINEDISGRTVVIVEDIVDTGRTMRQMMEGLGTRNPAAVKICSLFVKPDKLEEPLDVDYVAFNISDDFIVGYGLDYDQDGRGLKDVYVIDE
jgi:hypoxanthine phosphoribosyltransferase